MSVQSERRYELEIPIEQQSGKKNNKKINHNNYKKKANKRCLVNRIILMGLAFVATFLIIYNSSVITESKYANDKLDMMIAETNDKISRSNIALESLNNTSTIESYASSYLGMSYPNRKQTILINVDYVEEVAKQEELDGFNIFDFVCSLFTKE